MCVLQQTTDIKGIQTLFVKARVKPGMFILLVPAFAFSDRGGVTERLAGKGWGKKDFEYLSLLHSPGNQVSYSLLERSYIFSSFSFITNVSVEAFLSALHVPTQI